MTQETIPSGETAYGGDVPTPLRATQLLTSGSRMTGTDRALNYLRRAILRGELLPGEQLRQERLAAELKISRVPLREALLVLANQGLLFHERHQGFVVAKRSRDELAQLHLLLRLLEDELLSTITWPNQHVIGRLRDLNDQMKQLVEADDWIDIVELNHEFHCVVWQQSSLNLIVDQVLRIWPLADAYVARGYGQRNNRRKACADHDGIIDALVARDLPRLLMASEEHRAWTVGEASPTFV